EGVAPGRGCARGRHPGVGVARGRGSGQPARRRVRRPPRVRQPPRRPAPPPGPVARAGPGRAGPGRGRGCAPAPGTRTGVTRRALGPLLVAAVGLVLAPPASAHQTVPGVVDVLDRVVPPLPAGVTVQVAVSVSDQLVVANPTPTDLVVLGDDGEPFLRIGAQGTFANLRSPTWYRDNDPTGSTPPPPK